MKNDVEILEAANENGSPVNDDDPYVELVGHACRECPESGPWTLTVRDKRGRAVQYDHWDVDHSKKTGHKKFYQYRMVRHTARIM